jgi:geranylgeranyl reductase family protein
MNNTNLNRYDVTIVGAGPSGTVLAYLLAKKGLKVLLLEKARLPRKKTCAGGITVRAASLLPFDFQASVENVIYGVRLSYHLVPQRVRTYHLPLAYMVMRDKFDYFLAEKAQEAGAKLEDGVEVRAIHSQKDLVWINTRSGSFSTPVLVGADGANSAVVRSLGLRRGFDYGLGFTGYLEAKPDQLTQWDGLIGLDWGIKGGYAWVFPKKTAICVGAASSLRETRKLKPYTLKLMQAYNLGVPDARLIQGHLLPVRKSNTRLNFERVLLLGDAAGVIDPLTGEGIYYALKTSYLAAEAIINFMEGKSTDLSLYQRSVERDIIPELNIARTIQKMNSLTPWIFYHYLKNNDRFWRAFCRLLRGEKNYTDLKNSLIPPLRLLFRIM